MERNTSFRAYVSYTWSSLPTGIQFQGTQYVVMAIYYILYTPFHFLISTLWRLCGMQSEKYELYPKALGEISKWVSLEGTYDYYPSKSIYEAR